MLEHQPYDHALKSLMGDRAAEIIPQSLHLSRLKAPVIMQGMKSVPCFEAWVV
jgi:hypothetical protein